MLQEFILLFQYMTLPIVICLVVGLICVILEIFNPGFGVSGIVGVILLIAGVIWRLTLGHGNPIFQFFILLFLLLAIIISAFFIMLKSAKSGWLSKSSILAKETAVDTDISSGTANFVGLIDKKGIAVSDLKPTGKAQIDGEIYDVTCDSFYLSKGEEIRVCGVEGVRIVVKKIQ